MITDAGTMLINFASTMPQLMRLVTAFAYVFGMYLTIHGIKKLKNVGSNSQNGETPLLHCITFIVIGSALIYLPSTIRVAASTFWQNVSPLAYQTDNDGQWDLIVTCAASVIQLVGVISLIRGLIILTHHAAATSDHASSLQRGITHIIGGIFCVNIYLFVHTVLITLGIQ